MAQRVVTSPLRSEQVENLGEAAQRAGAACIRIGRIIWNGNPIPLLFSTYLRKPFVPSGGIFGHFSHCCTEELNMVGEGLR